MTIKDLYESALNFLTKPGRNAEEKFTVVIQTSEPHLSPLGVVPVKEIKIGTDYHKHEIIIVPEVNLIPQECDRDKVRQPIVIKSSRCEGAIIDIQRFCPNCQHEIDLDEVTNYCPHCGQKMRETKED